MSFMQEIQTAEPHEMWNEVMLADTSSVDILRVGEQKRKSCFQQIANKDSDRTMQGTPQLQKYDSANAELPFELDDPAISNSSIKFNQTTIPGQDQQQSSSLPRINSNHFSSTALQLHQQNRIRWSNTLILPNSMIKIIWDCYLLALLSFNIFYVPIKITWEDSDNGGGLILNEWVQIFLNDLPGWTFLFDIILNFNTAIYNKGNMIFNRKKIINHYIKTKFIGDLIIVIPFIVSLRLNINVLNAILLLRTNKMLKLAYYFEQLFNLKPHQAALYNLFKLVFMIIFVAHFCGCMFFLVSTLQKQYQPDARTWVDVAGIVNDGWLEQYITSLYWAVITMVTIGYGDIVPITIYERAFVILVTLISCGVFAYAINQIGVLISALTQRSNELKIKMGLLTRHLRHRGVSHNLQMQVRKYFEYWHQGREENDGEHCDQMIDSLSNTLRSEVLNDIRYRLINQMPILKSNFSAQFLKSMAMHIRTKRTKPEEVLIEEQQVNDKLYFLVQGVVCSFVGIKKDIFTSYTSMKQFKVQSIFDQVSFMADLRSLTGYRSIGSCTLYYICKEDFLKEIANYPSDQEKYQLIKDNIAIYRSQRNIGTKCPFCEKYTHSFDRCPYIKYIPYSEKQLTIYRALIQQVRMPHERRPQRFRAVSEYFETKERAVNYLIENNPFPNEEELIERLELINIGEDEFLAGLLSEINSNDEISHLYPNREDNTKPTSSPQVRPLNTNNNNNNPYNITSSNLIINPMTNTDYHPETLNRINTATLKNSSNLNNNIYSNAEFSINNLAAGVTPRTNGIGTTGQHGINQYETMLSGGGGASSFSDAFNQQQIIFGGQNQMMNGSGGQGGKQRKNVKAVRTNNRKKTRTEDLAIIKLRQAKVDAAAAAAANGGSGSQVGAPGNNGYYQPNFKQYQPNMKKIDEAINSAGMLLNNSIDYSECSQKSSHKKASQKKNSKQADSNIDVLEGIPAGRTSNLRKFTHEQPGRQQNPYYQQQPPQGISQLQSLHLIEAESGFPQHQQRRSSLTQVLSNQQILLQHQQTLQVHQPITGINASFSGGGVLSAHQASQQLMPHSSIGGNAAAYGMLLSAAQRHNKDTFMPIMDLDMMKIFTVYYPSGNYSNVVERVAAMIIKHANPKSKKVDEANKFKKSVNKIMQIRQLQNIILKKNISGRTQVSSNTPQTKRAGNQRASFMISSFHQGVGEYTTNTQQ